MPYTVESPRTGIGPARLRGEERLEQMRLGDRVHAARPYRERSSARRHPTRRSSIVRVPPLGSIASRGAFAARLQEQFAPIWVVSPSIRGSDGSSTSCSAERGPASRSEQRLQSRDDRV
jgi:hypothetical protein